MSLFLSHHKASLEAPLDSSPMRPGLITVDHFQNFDVGIEYFQNYIQKVAVPVSKKVLIIPKKGESLLKIKEFFATHSPNRHFLAEENPDLLQAAILNFEKAHQLLQLKKHHWEAPHWSGIEYFDLVFQDGIYIHFIGSHQGGINKQKFWGRFWEDCDQRNITSFTSKEDFLFVDTCIDRNSFQDENSPELEYENCKRNFKENFIDPYEEHCSFMGVSY